MNFFKTLSIIVLIIGSTILACNCGGVTGNIKRYHFYMSKDYLERIVNEVFQENPSLVFHYKDTSYTSKYYRYRKCIVYDNNNNKIILRFSYVGDSIYWKENETYCRIALVTGAIYGDTLHFAKNIEKEDKKLYVKLFEENVINKVKEKILIIQDSIRNSPNYRKNK